MTVPSRTDLLGKQSLAKALEASSGGSDLWLLHGLCGL